jgi:ankyrin repeat protein
VTALVCRQAGGAALGIACKNNHLDVAKILIDAGSDINVQNNVRNGSKRNPVHNIPKLLILEASSYLQIGETALMMATQCGNENIIRLLVAAGADKNNRDQVINCHV